MMQSRFAVISSCIDALIAKPGWALAMLAAAVATCALMPWDAGLQTILRGVDGRPGSDALLDLVRPFGRGEVAVLIALALAAGGRRRLGLQILFALVSAAIITWMLKIGVGRIRPNGAVFSFVSGDTSTWWALVPLLARTWSSGVIMLIIGGAVAVSRVVLGYHWPVDVLGAIAVGLFSGVVATRLCPNRLWQVLARRSTWNWAAAIGWGGCAVWALIDPQVGWMRIFLTVWGPAIIAWAMWSQVRVRVARAGMVPRWGLWVVVTVLAVLLTALASVTTLMDRDEPRNALAARTMLANGDYLVPSFNGEPRLHKPILPYWLMTAALGCGINMDLACRLPAIVCMIAVVLISALTAHRLTRHGGGNPAGAAIATAVVLASSPLILVCGSAATTDAVLMLGISVTMWVLVKAWDEGVRWWHIPACAVAIAWALLAKGPMGLLVPVAVVAGAVLWQTFGNRGGDTDRRPVTGVVITLMVSVILGSLLALAWFVPANHATDGQLWRVMIQDQVVNRVVEARESHGGGFWISLPYYAPVLLGACISWVAPLAVAIRGSTSVLPAWSGRIVLSWAVPVFVVVTLVQTKLPHYILPMLPPVAILIAATLTGPRQHLTWWRGGWIIQLWMLRVLVIGCVVVIPMASLVQDEGLLSKLPPLAPLLAPSIALGAGFMVLAWLLARTTPHVRSLEYASAAVLGTLAVFAALILNAGKLEVYKPSQHIAATINAIYPADVPVATCGFEEASLLYYLGPARGTVRIMSGSGDLVDWSRMPGPGVCIATRQRFDEAFGTSKSGLTLNEIGHFTGYNYANGRVLDLVLLGRQARVP